ncbi:D-methionine transport system ATP-binding protein [Anaerovirgula multivorans]|uniref:D-methionine transport system ATP-binding protein n=1 Tax=Anaerovirgula multivorans TaxID=312168 RepID=A0A239C118_9FIRM|nr:methionine ABC transporter ATP-binding protein [Anaerovirgula multivorans]SNS13937.1 D-methionine transport system ATP-binding protein [Anaerovirgula multivorans]
MIEIKNLKKSFGELQVLSDINLTIGKGKIYGLVGRSGAGKSTLLRCINGLENYEEGSLIVDGIEVKSLNNEAAREFRREIGMIFQQFSLLSRMTVYENIALPMKCWKYSKKQIDKKVKELVELVGISDKLYAKPREISGGQKQRVAIARALSMNPKILLCDEATSSLDPQTAKSIISLINKINNELGITIVIVTHQMSVLRSACEEISILENGRIAEAGVVEEIFLRQPKALRNLIGVKDLTLPQKGINLRILLSKELSDKPVITRMARELETDFMILGGEMENYRNSVLGSVIINISEENLRDVTEYLNKHKVTWKFIDCTEIDDDNRKGGEHNIKRSFLDNVVEIL